MRRILVIALALVAALAGTALPASASTTHGTATGGNGWVPVDFPPYDAPAGLLCDFGIHWDVVVNHVREKVVSTYPDGSPKREVGTGALFLKVTNTATGTSTIADASGTAVFDFGTDGSQVWHVIGPVIARITATNSNLPRGLWIVNGVYSIDISPTLFKTFHLRHATVHNLCGDLA